jgi:hypothetical protein
LPYSKPYLAVIKAPESIGASMIKIPSLKPAIILFLKGK